VRLFLVVRAALALLCAAGVVVSVISYQSQRSLDQGFHRVLSRQLDDRTRELLEDGRTLNPDTRVEQGLADVALRQRRDWEPFMRRALEREPDNVSLRALYSAFLSAAGRDDDARREYERASELDPQRFPPRPGGGG
jgi:cytochrome c-type biogenesis protein CcmH/NrfG